MKGKKKLFCGNTQKLLIVADCAKSEHLIHFFDCTSGRYLYKHPIQVKNYLAGFHFLREKYQKVLTKKNLQPQEVKFVLEDPASYNHDLIYFLQKEGFNVLYVNALQASKYRENNRASSDTLDLDGIVRSALMGQVYETDVCGDIYTKIKESHRERCRLVEAHNRHKNLLHKQIDQLFPGFLSQKKSGISPFSKACINLMQCKNFGSGIFLKAHSKRTLKLIDKAGFNEPEKIQQKLCALANDCLKVEDFEAEVIEKRRLRLQTQLDLYRSREECINIEEHILADLLQNTPYALLLSISGAGLITVSAIAAELGTPLKWPDADRIASYAGIIPRQKQSGGSQKSPIVTAPPKSANKYLKNALMTIVRIAKDSHHPTYKNLAIVHPLKAHFETVSLRGGSSYTATAKKLVRIIIAMLRDQTIYLPDINTVQPQVYRIWLEQGSLKMIKKWRERGISPTDNNILGKWLKDKEKIIALLDK